MCRSSQVKPRAISKDYIEKQLLVVPGGTNIVLKATYKEVDIIAVVHIYSSKKSYILLSQVMRDHQHRVNHIK